MSLNFYQKKQLLAKAESGLLSDLFSTTNTLAMPSITVLELGKYGKGKRASSKGLFISWFQKYGTGIRLLSNQKVVKRIIILFSVESLTLTKVNRLTITQRLKMIKPYSKYRDSTTAT